MEEKYYILKDDGKKLKYSPCMNLSNTKDMKNLGNDIKIKIISLLDKKPMYPSELAVTMKTNEQNLYYHTNQMLKSGILEISERKEIRGTVAKKLRPSKMNFSFSLSKEWKDIDTLSKTGANKKLESFLSKYMTDNLFDGSIVVGNPDPHGPFKARARDGHYAIDLAFFLGNILKIPDTFTTNLDVDIKIEEAKESIILVGGPVTNMHVSALNKHLPVKFSDDKPWGIISERTNKRYSEETNGLITKIPNPFNNEKDIIVIAGVSAVGTKAAVIAFTRHYHSLLQNFTDQKAWGAVINGFDLDGDGKVDSIELLE